MTYTLIGVDPGTDQVGIATQSHFFATGRDVPWVLAGVGAVATQAFVDSASGPRGLDLLRRGWSAPQVIEALLEADPARAGRQLAVVDASGSIVVHTGVNCAPTAGHVLGQDMAALGNILASRAVLTAMIDAFRACDRDLAERLLTGLEAGEAAGGDIRGGQSAALVVTSLRAGGPTTAVVRPRIDVRVDDHPMPLAELRRLVGLDCWYAELSRLLNASGLFTGGMTDDASLVERALAHLDDGRALMVDNQEPAFWLGVLLARLNRERDATQVLRPAIQARPSLGELFRRLGSQGGYMEHIVAQRILVGIREF